MSVKEIIFLCKCDVCNRVTIKLVMKEDHQAEKNYPANEKSAVSRVS